MDILEPYAGFIPGVAVSLALTLLLGRRLGSWLGTSPLAGASLIFAAGIVLSATVTPSHDALAHGFVGGGTCDLTRWGLPTSNQLRWPGEITLNILLFVPLGFAIGLLPSVRARPWIVALGYALPFAIEALQLVVLQLGRECQSGDVIDNAAGLTLGLFAASVMRWLGRLGPRAAGEDGARESRPGAPIVAAALAAIVLVSITLLTSPRAAGQASAVPPTATPAATATPMPGESVRVDSIQALLAALADPRLREIVVTDGTYHVSPAGKRAADSLWIGDEFAGRVSPITVRAETPGGVILDGGGARGFGGIWFVDGAHDQTWDGFTFANGSPTNTGVIMFGEGSGAAPHHISLRNIAIEASVTGRAVSASAPANDHGIYVSQALGGPHDLLFEDISVDGTGGLASAFHFYHSDASHPNAWNVTVRRLHVRGTQQAIMLWDPTLRDITFDTADIVDPLAYAVRFESPGATGIDLINMTSTGSGSGKGFESSLGPTPPGVTFTNDSLR